MKRDLDLIRDILLAIEDTNSQPAYDDISQLLPHLETKDPLIVSYHLELLNDSNYIETEYAPLREQGYTDFLIERMTSSGHDYLDNVREASIWIQTKNTLKNYGGSLSLDLIKIIAGKMILKQLNIS